MSRISIQITRDSVCAGDDDAPHAWTMEVSEMMPLKFVVQDIIKANYLARIEGGHATWVIEAGKPIAVVAQQWKDVRYLIDADVPISTVLKSVQKIHARYKTQEDPEIVFQTLVKAQRCRND